jgi:hypothetical protein
MVEVVVLDEFLEWYRELNKTDLEEVTRVVDMLEAMGTRLPYPYSSSIQGSTVALRELRVQSAGRPLRVLYAFDPKRQAVLLLGGDKTGDGRFYQRLVPRAEQLWKEYLDDV